ncbi:MAG: hypothetical protein SFY81_06500 [Verrucomicrobiota bacterium]|nr:hypothetical protein [Verrucomicrobiota bacterium]
MTSTPADIFKLYEEWRTLTEAETSAIMASNWAQVKQCQAAKQRLQEVIVRTTEEANLQWKHAGADLKQVEHKLRCVINELICMEMKNAEFLESRKAEVQNELASLDQSRRNLDKIQQSYSSAPRPMWQSFS